LFVCLLVACCEEVRGRMQMTRKKSSSQKFEDLKKFVR
jgi:hypothetical protein